MYQVIDGVKVWGVPDEASVRQAVQCSWVGDVAAVALMADHHKGYSQPIGGVVAYRGFISPSGVGYDIGCGNKAVRINIKYEDLKADLPRVVDQIAREISFGMGRKNPRPVDHELFDDPTWTDVRQVGALKDLAHAQLGTVGGSMADISVVVRGRDRPADARAAGSPRNRCRKRSVPSVWSCGGPGSTRAPSSTASCRRCWTPMPKPRGRRNGRRRCSGPL